MTDTKKKYNFTFFQDILRERRGGKYSSKKWWAFVTMLLLCAAFVVDGMHFYTVNPELFTTMAFLAGTLLGLGTINNVFGKSEAPKDEPEIN